MNGAYEGLRLASHAQTEIPNPEVQGDDATNLSTTKENEMTDIIKVENLATPLVAVSSVDLNARMKTVFAADAVKGKEGFAASLLGDSEFDALSAEAIVKLVAAQSVAAPNADESEVGNRMLAQIEANPNPEITPAGGEQKADDSDAGWKKATASVNKRNGF